MPLVFVSPPLVAVGSFVAKPEVFAHCVRHIFARCLTLAKLFEGRENKGSPFPEFSVGLHELVEGQFPVHSSTALSLRMASWTGASL